MIIAVLGLAFAPAGACPHELAAAAHHMADADHASPAKTALTKGAAAQSERQDCCDGGADCPYCAYAPAGVMADVVIAGGKGALVADTPTHRTALGLSTRPAAPPPRF